MKKSKVVEIINETYRQLDERAVRLFNLLKKLGHDVRRGYYNQHVASVNGEMVLESYPIPVITITDVCDVGLDLTHVFVEGKLYVSELEDADLSELLKLKLECYGADNYLEDLYEKGMSAEALKERAAQSGEQEIAFNVVLMDEPLPLEILEVVKLMERVGTHIIVNTDELDDADDSGACVLELEDNASAFEVADALEELF